ncbi:MAG TPA: hypothetical protein VGH28_15900 [Polyangiaceae bacterium]|jgi:hypothetical protein
MRARVSFIVLACVACRQAPRAPRADAGASPAACASTLASYDALVVAGGACSVDADCECFQGGVSTKSACGGVTDRATATKLEALRAEYEHASCDALSCAASLCRPVCVGERCTNGEDAPPRAK